MKSWEYMGAILETTYHIEAQDTSPFNYGHFQPSHFLITYTEMYTGKNQF